jgi:hypothetical protein
MGGLANPRKVFRYALEMDGVNMFLIQEVTPPSVELPETKHGSPGNLPDGKTPGKMVVGDLVVKKLVPSGMSDAWAWNWLAKAAVGLASEFSKIAFLNELTPDAVGTNQKFFLGAIWPKKIERSAYNASSNDNIIETVTFSVQYYYPSDSPEFSALFAGSGARAGGAPFAMGKAQ